MSKEKRKPGSLCEGVAATDAEPGPAPRGWATDAACPGDCPQGGTAVSVTQLSETVSTLNFSVFNRGKDV